ncbi:MAG: insulinase family protein [Phycisphaerales bacterium]|nr:insulinase family protein [Phycisphaerales bacterium]
MGVKFERATLSNGLSIVAETDPDAHSSAVGFFVKTGARDEDAAVMGVSHFLEHMMFKGTERRSADDVNREFDEIGASYNAFTTSEITAFHAHVLPEHLERATDILADILRPSLRVDDFDTEKSVILEEIAMYKDNPFWVLYERSMEEFYGTHGLGYRVLGTNESITALKRDQMKAYFDHRYSADNTTVALAGRVDFGAAVEQIESLCGKWQRTGAGRDNAAPRTLGSSFEIRDERINRAYMLEVRPGPAMGDEARYAAFMLAKVLGDPDNSRLHWALVEPGIAEEAQAGFEPNDGTGMYYIYASGDPKRADEIWSIVGREMQALRASLKESDLERLRTRLATSVTLAGEKPGGRMQRLGRLWPYLGAYISLEQELDRINAVTLDDLHGACDAMMGSSATVGRLMPGK